MSNQAARPDPAQSFRERAAQARDAAGRFIKRSPPVAPPPTHAEQVAEAALTGDVLAASGIDHRDGTVSYADATGRVVRHPMARWVAFNAVQMHAHVQGEISRQRIGAYALPAEEYDAWEARIRRELRVDAIAALTFTPGHAFQVEQDRRTGAEPMADGSILALIEEHRAAYDDWDRLSEVWSEMLTTDPGYAEAVAASEGPGQREIAAYEALFAARPTTLPGVIALTEYLREATERVSTNIHPSDAERALSIIASALRGIAAKTELKGH